MNYKPKELTLNSLKIRFQKEKITVDADTFEKIAMEKINLPSTIIPRYRSTYFNHIFAGGYSAGYYSYKWAEVLSADAFYMFIDSGNIFNKELGIKYRDTILSQGGSYDMDKLFFNFAQREPSIDSLLKIDGII